jgi:hypothetical protein
MSAKVYDQPYWKAGFGRELTLTKILANVSSALFRPKATLASRIYARRFAEKYLRTIVATV